MNTLHLDEENEQPPLILETDWAAGRRWNWLSDIAERVSSSGAAMGMCDLIEKGIKTEIILKQA